MQSKKSNALFVILSKLIEEEVDRQLKIKLIEMNNNQKGKLDTDLFTLKEVLKKLDISKTTLYRYRKEKGLKCIEVGKNLYFRKLELEQWLDENEKGGRCD